MPAHSSFFGDQETRFVASESYRSEGLGAVCKNVPVRATLKEFIGQWTGPLGGRLDGKLVFVRATATDLDANYRQVVGTGSFLHNNLGVTLKNCYLIETSSVVGPHRPFLTQCYEIGTLTASGDGSSLDLEQLRRRMYFGRAQIGSAPVALKSLPTLSDHINGWINEFRMLGQINPMGQTTPVKKLNIRQEYCALALLSVYGYLPEDSANNSIGLVRSHGRPLDDSHLLTDRTALLIGFSDDPPPATLRVDGDLLESDRSLTVYRILIPVERPESSI
jgi:hypothetical protein